jgi:hypothetical protein
MGGAGQRMGGAGQRMCDQPLMPDGAAADQQRKDRHVCAATVQRGITAEPHSENIGVWTELRSSF